MVEEVEEVPVIYIQPDVGHSYDKCELYVRYGALTQGDFLSNSELGSLYN